jgi:hypothetical protein
MSVYDFLPPLILMEDHQNDWSKYLEAIYEYFCQDFVTSKPTLEGKRFALKRYPMINGKEATFWHIISEGVIENERLPDLRRCERIRWPRAIIDAFNSHCDGVKYWRNFRKGEERVILALDDFSYIVVLADRGEYMLLWTAYCIERKHSRNKLRREYEEYLNGKG